MTMPPASPCVSELSFTIERETDLPIAQSKTRRFAADAGCNRQLCWKAAIVVSEAASNILKFAGLGTIALRAVHNDRNYIEIEARDQGPGIEDLDASQRDGYSENRELSSDPNVYKRRGLGTGLGAMRRLMDEVEITNPTGGGTLVRARKYY